MELEARARSRSNLRVFIKLEGMCNPGKSDPEASAKMTSWAMQSREQRTEAAKDQYSLEGLPFPFQKRIALFGWADP